MKSKAKLKLIKNKEPDRVMVMDRNGVFHLFPNTKEGRNKASEVENGPAEPRSNWFEKALDNIDSGKQPFEK